MKILLILTSLLTFSVFSKCLHVKSYDLKWTAFKTPLKKGVSGTFNNIILSSKRLKSNVSSNQFNSSIEIATKSVNSSNIKRDKNLTVAFFSHFLGTSTIKVEILNAKNKVLNTLIKMNNKNINVPFNYTYSNKTLKANGVIDLLDFSLLSSLNSLNNKCNKAHQGKTWSDVTIEFNVKFDKCD